MASFLNKAKDKLEATLNKNDNKNDNYNTHENVTHPTQTGHVGGHGHPAGAEGVHTSNVGGLGGVQGENYGHTAGIGGVQGENYGHTAGHSGIATSGIATSGAYGSETRTSEYDNPRSTNAGPHSSNLLNKLDPRTDSDRDHRNDPTSRVGGYGTQGENYGHAAGHGGVATSGIATSGHHGTHETTSSGAYGSNTNAAAYDNPQSTNTGPHSSNLLNKLDPRADSDRDHRNDPTSRVGGHGNTQQYGDDYGQAGLNTSGAGYGPTTTSGFDSGVPATHHATTHGGHNTQAVPASGLAAATTTGTAGHGIGSNTYDNPRSENAGPHSSNLMNKLDPRHDSDRDHRNDPTSRVGGYGAQDQSYGHNTGGYGSTTSGYEGGTTGSAGQYGSSATPGSGNAQGTAGPHNSNILNKLDPRVDSDMDGSKTYGGNQTHR